MKVTAKDCFHCIYHDFQARRGVPMCRFNHKSTIEIFWKDREINCAGFELFNYPEEDREE